MNRSNFFIFTKYFRYYRIAAAFATVSAFVLFDFFGLGSLDDFQVTNQVILAHQPNIQLLGALQRVRKAQFSPLPKASGL